MARTFGALIFYDASQLQFTGTTVYTRQAKGDVSLNQGASVTVQYQFGLADIKRPYFAFASGLGLQGTFPNSNEFGQVFGAASGPGNPVSGGSTGAVFETPTALGGVAIIDIFAVYSVAGAALTAATLGVSRQAYANNAAFTITDVIAPTATGKTATTTSISTPYVATVAATQPFVFEATDLSDLLVELVLTTQAAGSARVYGLGAHVAVQYP